jgi:hypothetical protein
LPTPLVGGYLLSGTPNFSRVDMDLVTHFFWARARAVRVHPTLQVGVRRGVGERVPVDHPAVHRVRVDHCHGRPVRAGLGVRAATRDGEAISVVSPAA